MIIRRALDWWQDDEGRFWCPRECGFFSCFKGRVVRHYRQRRCLQ